MSADENAKQEVELNPDEAKELLKAIEEVEREEADQQASHPKTDDPR